MELVPDLRTGCKKEITLYCQNIVPGSGKIGDCLYKEKNNLDSLCRLSLIKLKYLPFYKIDQAFYGSVFKLIISFSALLVLFVSLEKILFKRIRLNVEQAFVDLQYFLLNSLFSRNILMILVIMLVVFYVDINQLQSFSYLESWKEISGTNPFKFFVVYFVLADFIGYWGHRLMHTRFFWKFHKIHHSTRNLDWHSNFRDHPVNTIIQGILITFPVVFLGLIKNPYNYIFLYKTAYDCYTHSNFFGGEKWIKYFFVTPHFHHYHHKLVEHPREFKNFAGFFPVWDILFGTSCFHYEGNIKYGVENSFPQTLLKQVIKIKRK